MKIYQVYVPMKVGDCHYEGTLKEAHARAKWHNDDDVRIELIEVPVDKAGVLTMLNSHDEHEFPVISTWRLTPRDGLVECPNGE